MVAGNADSKKGVQMMAGKKTTRETDLYAPIRRHLVAQGYTVRGEVKGCDITAVKGEDLIVIELKRSFSASLLVQATQRQRVADSVYVALPRPSPREMRGPWRGIRHLLRRLELGLIFVDFAARRPEIEIVFHPLPYDRKRDNRVRRAILQEIAGRSGEYNQGGSTRRKIVTVYRENAIFIAVCLDVLGPLAPKRLRAFGTGSKTLSVLYRNFYGWFERVAHGLYALKPEGRAALAAYPDLVARFRKKIETPST
jgi:hypothetical protein